MTGLGDRLKAARTEKGYTLDDLQEITKIQKRYLADIEVEQFDSMPGAFYVRAFIKQYAEAVDVDPEEALALYRQSAGKIEQEEETIQSTALSDRVSKRSRASSSQLNEYIPKLIVILFIVLVVAVIYFLKIQGESSKQQELGKEDEPITFVDEEVPKDDSIKTPEATDEEVEEEESVLEEESTDKEVTQTLTHTSITGQNSTYMLAGPDKVALEIRTTGDSWIGVTDSNGVERMPEPRKADVYTAGEAVTLDVSDTESIRIRVGRTESTEIYINGERLNYESDRTTQNIIIEYEK